MEAFLVVNKMRIEASKKSKNEIQKYAKELYMGKVYANNGSYVEMIEEVPRVPSPDAKIDGVLAEFKKLSSHNNIIKEAKDAIKKKKAEEVLFQFDIETKEIHTELEALKRLGIKCRYFFTGRESEIFTP